MPSILNGTISAASCGVASVQRIPRKGRTQRSASDFVEAFPQRIDFGQGKARTTSGTISATASAVGRPGFSITAT